MKILIIGGGASGLVAAISSARNGAEVIIIEKNDRIGKKILATGNGRCNYTNVNCSKSDYNSNGQKLVEQALKNFGPSKTIEFFSELGIFPREEAEGRLYPYSEQAASVLDVLRMEISRLGIKVKADSPVKAIEKHSAGGFFALTENEEKIFADKIIISTGGNAGTQYGCAGDGYKLAEKMGHHIVRPRPALVQLLAEESYFKQLKGIRAKGKVSLIDKDKLVCEEDGEIQFTEYGLSGICIFNLSNFAVRIFEEKKTCVIKLDLFPQVEPDKFQEIIQMRIIQSEHKTAEELFNGMINKRLIPVLLKLCGINDIHTSCKDLTDNDGANLAWLLKNWNITVKGTRPWSEAQVTSGGVEAAEINPTTMESKLMPGIFFAGEIIDVDGKCGGYNLQWAWSSGYLAGLGATEKGNS